MNWFARPPLGGITKWPWRGHRKPPAELVVLTLFRQPDSIITASRRAKFKIPSEEVRKCIAEQIILAIDDSLGKNDENIGYRALFRASLGVDISDLDLLLPVIRNGVLNWEFWDEKRFRTTDCIIVPFFLPLMNRNLLHELPIVGVPRRTAFGPSRIVPKISSVSAISLNESITGALNGPSMRYNHERLEKGYTFLLYRLCRFNNKNGNWEKVNDELAIQSPIRNQMYSWDLESDSPWNTYGFDASKEISWYSATKYLKDLNISNNSIEPVCISVNLREWNYLNRSKDERFSELLMDLLLRGCE